MILKPNQGSTASRKSVIIQGVPGIGKSTLALSAPDPLIVITDPSGWDRIPAHCRVGGRIEANDYQEILDDLKPETVAEYQTIIIDTGGSLINLMKAWVIRKNPKNGQSDGTTLTMRGYGAIKGEFASLVTMIREVLRKHFVITFHVKDEKDGDQTVYRLDCEGSTKADIWKPMDLGGFMETVGNKRTITFSPTDRYYAKGTHGIEGTMELPDVMKGHPNDFLTTLFARIDQNVAEEAALNEKYNAVMNQVRETVAGITNAKTANEAREKFKAMDHVYGSLMEARHLFSQKVTELGLKFDREADKIVSATKEAKQDKEPETEHTEEAGEDESQLELG